MLIGFATENDAMEANSCSGYSGEVVDLSAPFGGAAAGTGYALLARHGNDYRSPLGCSDARIHLPDRWIDGPRSCAAALGLAGDANEWIDPNLGGAA